MKRIFTLGASTIPGEYILPRLLYEIIRQVPMLEVRVDTMDSMRVFEKVKAGAIEIGIIGTWYSSPEVDSISVVKGDHLVFIAPKGHPLSGKKGVTIDDLKGQVFIAREPGSGTRAAYEKALEDAGLPMRYLNVVAEIEGTSGIIQAVEDGIGISVVSEIAAEEAIEQKRVSLLDIPMLTITRDFYIITRNNAPLSKDAVFVLSAIMNSLKN